MPERSSSLAGLTALRRRPEAWLTAVIIVIGCDRMLLSPTDVMVRSRMSWKSSPCDSPRPTMNPDFVSMSGAFSLSSRK